MEQIGEYYYGKHQAGETDDPDAAEFYAAIDTHNRTIADTQAEITRIKTESAAQTEKAAVPVPAQDVGVIRCPSCNRENVPDSRFCSECGYIANQLYFKHTIIFHSAAFRAMLQARNEK